MTSASFTAAPTDRRAMRNVIALFFAQAILGAQMPINFVLGGLAGSVLTQDKALSTLPISVIVLAAMFSTAPASLMMGRIGRRAGFLVGAAFGALGGALSALALVRGQFALLLAGAACTGVYMAFQGYFRFAATDTASAAFKPKAVSWVLAGGLIGALIGPEILSRTRDALAPAPFAGTYLAMVAVNLIGSAALAFIDIPKPPRRTEQASSGRPLGVILRQPVVIIAILCAMVSAALMNLTMTSTPLAMMFCGFDVDQAADVVRWHAVAMFAPSFFTGGLIQRFGHLRIIGLGLTLLAGCGLVALTGVELGRFYIALVLLGVGWNFGFIGSTSLLASAHEPEERAKVQGFNDFLVFGLVSAASLSSGALMYAIGWDAVNLAMIPFLALAASAIIWLALTRR